MNVRLPINKKWISTDRRGRTCVVEVKVESTQNLSIHPPDGVKSVFTVKRERTAGLEDFELILLIDNHAPFGFHEHPKLPIKHEYRRPIHVTSWQDAWLEFEKRLEEILNEA